MSGMAELPLDTLAAAINGDDPTFVSADAKINALIAALVALEARVTAVEGA